MDIGIYRSTTNKWLFGVCGGVADRLGVSAKLVRLAVVIIPALPGGLAIPPALLVYLVLGLVLPKDTERSHVIR